MIEIRGLQKIIGERTVLDIPSLIVDDGEIVSILGSAGSGIGTLFDILTRQLTPSAGELLLGDDGLVDKTVYSQRVGVLFPDDGLYLRQSAYRNLQTSCQVYGLSTRRAEAILESVGLADQKNAQVEKFTGSQRRRLAFGRAILHQPVVLLLYEPFDRCDEATIRSLRRHIIELASTGVSILILTDNPEQIEGIATRIYRMKNGKLEEEQLQDIPTITPFKIPIKYNDRVILINPVDVLYIEAVSGASMLHTREERLDSAYTLSDLEARLGRSGFFRTHRSYLVNLQHVREVIPYTRNSFSLRLNDTENTEIPLSKAAASELRALLDY